MPDEILTPATDEVVPDATVVDAGSPEGGEGNGPEDNGTDALGDAGKRALDAMKAKWHAERDARRKLEAERDEALTPKPSGTTDQPDADAIRTQTRAEVQTEFAVQLEAKGRLANPSDVARYPEYFKDLTGGDPVAVKAAVDELLEENPHLAATGQRPVFQGTADGGAARKASGPTQLTRDALKGMSPEAIVKAKRDGRLKNLLTGD